MALTQAEVDRLHRMIGQKNTPEADRLLSDADLQDIAEFVGRTIDSAGLTPADVGYVPTYDLYRVAAEAYRNMAGLVAEDFDFGAEGSSFKRSQKYTHYIQQAARYAGMARSLSSPMGSLE